MSTKFVIVSENNVQKFKDISFKGAAVKYEFNFAPWQDDNNTITGVVWEVKSGQATISGEALTSAVATALVTFGESGSNLIKLTASTAASGVYVAYLDVLATDPQSGTNDYGIII